ncbi:MAG: YaiO family outer membrane beta-barrel protein [Betaproteobacteria bacterium]|nr:YaiO family outer membrane beta-barrel protein [Betaproteobacteria bacterium]
MRPAARPALLVLLLLAAPGAAPAAGDWRIGPEIWRATETLDAKTPGASYSPWRESGFAAHARHTDTRLYSLRGRETERFALTDREWGFALHQPLGSGWAADVDAAVSDTHRVLARHVFSALIEKRLAEGWGVQGGWRRSQYAAGYSDLRQVTVDRYFGVQRLAYTLYSGHPEGGAGSVPGHRVQWSYFLAEHSSFGVSAAAGRETDIAAPGVLATSDIRDYALTVRHGFAAGWTLSADAVTHEQGNLYRRHGFRFGLQLRF